MPAFLNLKTRNSEWIFSYIGRGRRCPRFFKSNNMENINLNTVNRIPDDLREILEQAPEGWGIVALYDYMERNVSIEQIRRDWERDRERLKAIKASKRKTFD